MTLMLEFPEDLAPRLLAIPEKERHNFALAAMRVGLEEEADDEIEMLPEHFFKVPPQALRKAQEEIDHGEFISGKVFLSKLDQPLD